MLHNIIFVMLLVIDSCYGYDDKDMRKMKVIWNLKPSIKELEHITEQLNILKEKKQNLNRLDDQWIAEFEKKYQAYEEQRNTCKQEFIERYLDDSSQGFDSDIIIQILDQDVRLNGKEKLTILRSYEHMKSSKSKLKKCTSLEKSMHHKSLIKKCKPLVEIYLKCNHKDLSAVQQTKKRELLKNIFDLLYPLIFQDIKINT